VLLRRDDEQITLTVHDDGRGADLRARQPGFGLNGMRERVTLMGGRFDLDSAPGRGFSFEARLPANAGADR
jgi:signal transduction histidine kinase